MTGQPPRVNPFSFSSIPIPIDDDSPPPPSSSTPPPPTSTSPSPPTSISSSYSWSSHTSTPSPTPPTPHHPYRPASAFDGGPQFSRKKQKHPLTYTPIQSSSAVTAFPPPNPHLVGSRAPRPPRPPRDRRSRDSRPTSDFSTLLDSQAAAADAANSESVRILSTPLSPGQQSVVDAVLAYKSVFFTGCAGTGKSFLLNYLKLTLPKESTFFTASTGLAAVNVRGSTVHSFAGVGLGLGSKEQLYESVNTHMWPKKRWLNCKCLVIDEVSMIDCALFDKLEYIARRIRKSEQPFGGIQLILTGDFLQLPPVLGTGFCFESKNWTACVHEVIELDSVFRQADESLVSVLNSVRRGKVTEAVVGAFSQCINRQFDVSDGHRRHTAVRYTGAGEGREHGAPAAAAQ